MPFTKEQHAAIQHEKGPMLVIAGPGSGKTAVLTHRLARLVSTGCAKPEEILVITFTRAAAREMRERYLQLVPAGAEPVIRTFHAAFYEILRREQKGKLTLLESGQATEILASWFRMEKKASPEEAAWKTDFVLAEYSRFRNTGIWDKLAILKIM